ncbi:MAG: hypothetical protein HRF50_07225 [Phycisphaerae bacterium]|jgi:hypothetical protein
MSARDGIFSVRRLPDGELDGYQELVLVEGEEDCEWRAAEAWEAPLPDEEESQPSPEPDEPIGPRMDGRKREEDEGEDDEGFELDEDDDELLGDEEDDLGEDFDDEDDDSGFDDDLDDDDEINDDED